MAGNAKLKLILERVEFTKKGRKACSGKVRFDASVQRTVLVGLISTALGDRNMDFNPREDPVISLDWSAELDLEHCPRMKFMFNCIDQGSDKKSLGRIEFTLEEPWVQHECKETTVPNGNYTLVWTVYLSVGEKFKLHAPNTTFIAREHRGAVEWSTVAGVKKILRLELCPVRPVPPDGELPKRFEFPNPKPKPQLNKDSRKGVKITAKSPPNAISNPPVIPILKEPKVKIPKGTKDEDLDKADWANHRNAARIEYTYYCPEDMKFKEDDKRLEWRKLEGAGEIKFLAPPGRAADRANKGLNVFVYGIKEGEVVLGIHFENKLLARYRAMVYPLKQLFCRYIILCGDLTTDPSGTLSEKDVTPVSAAAHINGHRRMANIFLRQLGIKLVPDIHFPPPASNAVTTGYTGIFKMVVDLKYIRNATINDCSEAMTFGYNAKEKTLIFLYICSRDTIASGTAFFWPKNKKGTRATATITDSGTPSSSWIVPSGILPDDAAGTVNMKIIDERIHPDPVHPELFGMLIMNSSGNKPGGRDALMYAKNIAHEVGHMLSLGHRVEEITDATLAAQWNAGTLNPGPGGTIAALTSAKLGGSNGAYDDGLWHPRRQNVMHFSQFAEVAQDFDILQAKAVRESKLLDWAI